jgi:NAD(P) transhydrogenase subunit beta
VSAVTELLYLISAALFILALRWMSQPDTARRAVAAAVTGMALAVGGTLLHPEIVTYKWIAIAAIAGTMLGIPLARVPLTAVPERTGLSQAFGGLGAGRVGIAKY